MFIFKWLLKICQKLFVGFAVVTLHFGETKTHWHGAFTSGMHQGDTFTALSRVFLLISADTLASPLFLGTKARNFFIL
ncbi:MAG: hypothetical protein LBG69_05125 [Zoogloeaceae bacterium]|jgi:hypothetical protein|nr:hypothetical protein [Zoogloeaceae bacterium]